MLLVTRSLLYVTDLRYFSEYDWSKESHFHLKLNLKHSKSRTKGKNIIFHKNIMLNITSQTEIATSKGPFCEYDEV